MANELDNLLSHEAMQRNRESSIEPQGWSPRDPLGTGPFWNAPTSVKTGGAGTVANIEELLSIITNPQALLDIGGAIMASKVMGESPMGILEAFMQHSPESVKQTRAANEARAEEEGLNWMGQLLSEGVGDAALGGFAGLARHLARRAGRSGATRTITPEIEILPQSEYLGGPHPGGPTPDVDVPVTAQPADSPDDFSLPVDSPEAQQQMDEAWQAANRPDDPGDSAVYDLQGRQIRTTSMDVFDAAEGTQTERFGVQGGIGGEGGPSEFLGRPLRWPEPPDAADIPTRTAGDPLTPENRLRNIVEDTLNTPGVRGDPDEARGWHIGTELEDRTTKAINEMMAVHVPRDPSGKRTK